MTIKNGWYKHFKGGYYYVISMAKHSETLEDMVIYCHQENSSDFWVRPASMWEETVNGKPRFEYVGDNSIFSDGTATYFVQSEEVRNSEMDKR